MSLYRESTPAMAFWGIREYSASLARFSLYALCTGSQIVCPTELRNVDPNLEDSGMQRYAVSG